MKELLDKRLIIGCLLLGGVLALALTGTISGEAALSFFGGYLVRLGSKKATAPKEATP